MTARTFTTAIRLLIIPVLLALLAACSATPERHPAKQEGYVTHGQASYYAQKYHHKQTASGETFDQYAMTAAHKTLPFGTRVKVTNTRNGKSVVVKINDRGPFVKGRIIDLSRSAFESIGNLRSGVIPVTVEVIR